MNQSKRVGKRLVALERAPHALQQFIPIQLHPSVSSSSAALSTHDALERVHP